ncbi:Uncharacterised protein [Vibrio cholerae]|nr:Uncharacterised protein [Vibrio cholerae]CSB90812.1 Uncharacterised protein [Vibrio cholerae]
MCAACLELLWRINRADKVCHQFLGRLHFTHNFIRPFMGDMAVRTDGANPRTV